MKDQEAEKQNEEQENTRDESPEHSDQRNPREDLQDMVKLMEDHDLAELEYEDDACHIRLRKKDSNFGGSRNHSAPPVQNLHAPPQQQAAPAAGDAPNGGARTEAPTSENDGSTDDTDTQDRQVIKSPLVGTFYRAPAPDADPFIEEGDEVDEDTVVCIIEAMKVMNEIKAETSGTVQNILVSNGEAVDFDQPIIEITSE